MESKNYNSKKIIIGSIFTLLISFALVYISFKLRTPTRMDQIYTLWKTNPLPILLNMIPIILSIVIILAISGRFDLAVIITTLIAAIIIFININKILIREEPLVLSDISIMREAIAMVENFDLDMKQHIVGLIGISIGYSVIIYFLFRNYKISRKTRLITFVAGTISSIVLLFTVYSSKEIYDSLPRLQEYETNLSQSYTDKGVFYAMLYNRHTHKIQMPESYDRSDIDTVKQRFEYSESADSPHVVMIMGEAWTDMSEPDVINFKEGQDPFINAREMMEESIYSGQIVCPSYGGGTANTEYDTLTGLSTKFLSEGVFTSYSALRGPIKSIAQVFKDNKYSTTAVHPGDGWFYNRENVYRYLGFDDMYFNDDFENPAYKGGYISEEDMTSFIIDTFEDRYRQGPQFLFGVTIQNHYPFTIDKYDTIPDSFDSDDIDPNMKESLETLFVGIRDMDQQIKDLKEYLNSIDEPIVFVYYGDHQPSLPEGLDVFRQLGYQVDRDDSTTMGPVYSTPFFIWGNDNYMSTVDEHENYDNKDLYISANYLSSIVLEAAELVDTDYFYQYLSNLRHELPVMSAYFYNIIDDGKQVLSRYSDLPDDKLDAVLQYKNINYDLATGAK